jgi:hypothetical protein
VTGKTFLSSEFWPDSSAWISSHIWQIKIESFQLHTKWLSLHNLLSADNKVRNEFNGGVSVCSLLEKLYDRIRINGKLPFASCTTANMPTTRCNRWFGMKKFLVPDERIFLLFLSPSFRAGTIFVLYRCFFAWKLNN